MPQIQLVPITADNFRACIDLKVREEQRSFVADNLFSLAQVYVYPTWRPLAIAAGDTLVGFVLTGPDEDPNADHQWIIRFMIGEAYQGQGYGKPALLAIIAQLKAEAPGREIRLSYMPGNAVAERLYQAVGFAPTGEIDDGEIVMRLGIKI